MPKDDILNPARWAEKAEKYFEYAIETELRGNDSATVEEVTTITGKVFSESVVSCGVASK